MTARVPARDALFEATVIGGGALGAMAIDIATRTTTAGYADDALVSPAMVELLLRSVRPDGPLTRACGGAPASEASEVMIAGPERALYCSVLDRGELIILAAPAAMSVALGWTLVRALITRETERRGGR